MDFSRTGRYDVVYNHILTHKYYINLNRKDEVSMEEAIESWFKNVYMPIVTVIHRKHIMHRFPKRTISDMYVWVVRYWDDLKQKFGDNVSLDTVVENFDRQYHIPFYRRIVNSIKKNILRKELTLQDSATPEESEKN